MRLFRIRNRILQLMYRPNPARSRFFSPQLLAQWDAIDTAIEEKITPLLSGLWKE